MNRLKYYLAAILAVFFVSIPAEAGSIYNLVKWPGLTLDNESVSLSKIQAHINMRLHVYTPLTLLSCGEEIGLPDGVCSSPSAEWGWPPPYPPVGIRFCPVGWSLDMECWHDCQQAYIDAVLDAFDVRCAAYETAVAAHNTDVAACSDNYDDCILIFTTTFCDAVCEGCTEDAADTYAAAAFAAEQALQQTFADLMAAFNLCNQGCCIEDPEN